MSEFFQHYPQISYDISGTKPVKVKTIINLMEKAKIKSAIKDDIVAYFPYSIMEGERPIMSPKRFMEMLNILG